LSEQTKKDSGHVIGTVRRARIVKESLGGEPTLLESGASRGRCQGELSKLIAPFSSGNVLLIVREQSQAILTIG
jgi:hypothetical protein